MNQNETKVCSRCKIEYPNTNEFFYKKRDKLRSICKECDKELRKERAKKEKGLKIRVSLKEKDEKAISKKAEKYHMSRNDFLKLMILKSESVPFIKINPECFVDFNYKISEIAHNVNDIAHNCNRTKNVTSKDIENLKEELKKIREWQSKLEEEFKMINTSIRCANEVLSFDDI